MTIETRGWGLEGMGGGAYLATHDGAEQAVRVVEGDARRADPRRNDRRPTARDGQREAFAFEPSLPFDDYEAAQRSSLGQREGAAACPKLDIQEVAGQVAAFGSAQAREDRWLALAELRRAHASRGQELLSPRTVPVGHGEGVVDVERAPCPVR